MVGHSAEDYFVRVSDVTFTILFRLNDKVSMRRGRRGDIIVRTAAEKVSSITRVHLELRKECDFVVNYFT